MKKSAVHQLTAQLQPLEARVTPATLINPTTVTYQDVDGDTVTVAISKPVFTADTLATVFQFDTGGFGSNATPQQLQQLDLTTLAAQGAKLSVTAKNAAGKPSTVNVGSIEANGVDLKKVVIAGDLGSINAGDDNLKTAGVKSLTVASLGVQGTTLGSDLQTTITGALGVLLVRGDVLDASVGVTGDIGSVLINGSLLATTTVGGAASLYASGNIGQVQITGDIVGHTGAQSGAVLAEGTVVEKVKKKKVSDGLGGTYTYDVVVGYKLIGGTIGTVAVGGKVQGGGGAQSGTIGSLLGSVQKVTLGGALVGSGGDASGSIFAQSATEEVVVGDGDSTVDVPVVLGGNIGTVQIGGSVTGGTGQGSGSIVAENGHLVAVTITGDLAGASGPDSGVIAASGSFKPNTRTRRWSRTFSEYGYSQTYRYSETKITGYKLVGGTIGSVRVGGDVVGGAGVNSGTIASTLGNITTVQITGELRGGSGAFSGSVTASSEVEDLIVGDEESSVEVPISLGGHIGRVTVGEAVTGATGTQSGAILANGGNLIQVQIGGDLTGSDGIDSGQVSATGSSKPTTRTRRWSRTVSEYGYSQTYRYSETKIIGYKLIGGMVGRVSVGGNVTGGLGPTSGAIGGWNGGVGQVTIRGDVQGGQGESSASIFAQALVETLDGEVPVDVHLGGSIKAIAIGGSLRGGQGAASASLNAAVGSVTTVAIAGDVVGGAGLESAAIVATGAPVPKTRVRRFTEYGYTTKVTEIVGYKLVGGQLPQVQIGGDVRGGSGIHSGAIGSVLGSLGAITIRGSLEGGTGLESAAIFATAEQQELANGNEVAMGGTIGTINILGNVLGHTGAQSASLLADRGIVAVNVSQNWVGANIIAGKATGADNVIDTGDDVLLFPTAVGSVAIGSITIRGQLDGAPGPTTGPFRFTAPTIGTVKIGGQKQTLTKGAANDILDLTSQFKLVEFTLL